MGLEWGYIPDTSPSQGGGARLSGQSWTSIYWTDIYGNTHSECWHTKCSALRSIRPTALWWSILQNWSIFSGCHLSGRKCLRVAHQRAAYEFLRILFGLSLAPRVFSNCVEVALFPLRNSGIRTFSEKDDYLVCSNSWEQVIKDSVTVLNHLRTLGFRKMRQRVGWSRHSTRSTWGSV